MSLSPSNREFCPLLFQKALDWVGEETDLTPSTKWLACVYYAVVFNKTKVFIIIIILRWKVHLQKTINGKEKFQKKSQFPFCRQTKPFSYEIIPHRIKPCFLHGGARGLFLEQPRHPAGLLRIFK